MAGKNPEIKIEYKVVNQAFNQGLKEMQSQTTTLNKEFAVQKEQMKNTASESDKLEASVSKLNQEYTLAEQKTKMVESALQNTKEITGENSKETQQWSNKLLDAQKNQEHLKNSLLETNQALDKAKQAESQLSAEQEKLSQNTKRLDTLFEATGKSLDDYTDVLGTRLVDAIRKGEASSDQLEVAINKIGKSALGADADLGKMKNALDQVDNGSSIDDVTQDLRGLSTESDKTADALEDMGDKINAGNLLEGAEALGEVSDKVTEIGTAAFDSAMTIDDLASRYNNAFGLTGDEAAKTKDKIVDLYKSGLVDSYEEAADVLIQTREQIAGLNDESLDDVSRRAAAFANTFDADIPETLRGANALMNVYGMTAEQAFDLMTVGAQNGLNKTDELGDNLAEYATLFDENGYSASEMFNILHAGLDGGAYNLDKVNDLVKEFGVRVSDGTIKTAVSDLGGNFESLFNTWEKGGGTNKELFSMLGEEISGMSSEQEKASAISAIFGSMGEDAGTKVIEAMSLAANEVNGVKTMFDETADASNKLMESADSQNITSMWRELKEMLTPIGEQLMKLAVEYMPKVIEGIKGIVEWFKNLGPYAKSIFEFVGIFGGLALVIAPIAAAVAGIVALLGSLAVPVLFVVGVIATIIMAVKNWGAITDWLSEKWNIFTTWLSESWQLLYQKAGEVFSALGEFFSNLWTSIIQSASESWNSFTTTISEIWTGFTEGAASLWSGFIEFFAGIWTRISTNAVEIWSSFTSTMSEIFTNLGNLISETWTNISTFAIEVWNSLVAFMTPIIQNLINVIMVPISLLQTGLQAIWLLIVAGATIAWEALKIAASAAWGFIKNAIITPIQEAWAVVSGKIQEMWLGIVTKFDEIKTATLTKWSEIKASIAMAFTLAKNTVIQIATEIWTNVVAKFDQVKNSTIEKWNEIKNSISNSFTSAKNTVVSIASAIWTSIVAKFDQVKNAAIEKWNRVKSAITGPLTSAKNTAVSVASGIWSSLTSKFEQIRSTTVTKFNSIKNSIIDPIREAKNKVSGFIDSIKGFFSNLKLKIPKPSMPSMPSFSLKTSSKTVFGKEITYPSGINVKWNAKGGIMTKPTIFGSMGNTLMGGGEAGAEAIIPLNKKVLSGIGEGIFNNTQKLLNSYPEMSSAVNNVSIVMNNNIANDYDMNQAFEKADIWLASKGIDKNFGKGRK